MAQTSEARTDSPLLEVRDLSISFARPGGETSITRNVSFDVNAGERVGVVGESGCGKTVTGLALLGLLPRRTARIRGRILFQGRDLLTMPAREFRRLRGRDISMIFQEPMSALDPVFTVGEQLTETLRSHEKVSRAEARERAIAALEEVGIPSPHTRIDEYPYQFSGGMRQRVMIAMALICRPKLVIADEPTTALDVTVQAQIIDLLRSLSDSHGTALLFITHDLGVVAETCSRLLTMYAGEVVENAPVDDVLLRPGHPYSSGLLRSLPGLSERGSRLPSIPGRVPAPDQMPAGCRFQQRCPHAAPLCEQHPELEPFQGPREVRCWRKDELTLTGAV
ncbi:oligopeptide/dipeptide ABC transporter, ATP-binding protein-like [Alcanivorax balearicus MACL04]|uniref:ABC-type dipeptide transporter n=1 Tax=Alloalcanivorax balearicus MACL04 TaxID=1177182 RepID=A0ABT2R0Q9_9GAMM|nr:ABC transporter ATP-binding protein [Alloalcanivorax balearicus]MCU5783378.1 oligopeptide/dipeptide ABC transporter, ATP-binding protein-like [Alloalcanivorax balearicus MACL04]